MTAPRLVPPSDVASWREAALAPGHGRAFVVACGKALGLEALLWTWSGPTGRVSCPLLLRPLDAGRFDVVTPIGFGGLATQGTIDGWQEAWRSDWSRRGAVTGYVQLCPGVGLPALLDQGARTGPRVARWAIDATDEALHGRLARDHRARLRKWQGTEPRVEYDTDEARTAFCTLYPQFAAARGVSAPYRLTARALEAVVSAPGAMVVAAGSAGGPLVASALFLRHGARADYTLNGSAPEGRVHARGLVWSAARRLRDDGVQIMDLGGGVMAGDSLERFKVRFGARLVDTQVWCSIIDEAEYHHRCTAAGTQSTSTGWFPSYRAPT